MAVKRIAVVTGTSRGIGLAIAKGLAAKGLLVIGTSRDAATGKPAADEAGIDFHPLDVADGKSVDAFAEWLGKEHGGFDVLVNNAGISLDGFDAKLARRTLDVNFGGTVKTTDRLLPLLRDKARIVVMSSGMGELSCLGKELREKFADPSLSRDGLAALVNRFVREIAAGTHEASGFPSNAYRVSKVAVNAYVRILARELLDNAAEKRTIKVNAACPGWVRTQMAPNAPRTPEEGAATPAWLALLPEEGPTGGFFRDQHAIPW